MSKKGIKVLVNHKLFLGFKISKFEFLQALCFWGSSVDICLKEVVMHVRVFLMFGSHPR